MHTIPTVGFNVETVNVGKLDMTIWDVGGQDKIRPLWRHYYQGTQALVFVIDSADRDRVDQARNELHRLLQEEELQNAHILVFANKQDLPGAVGVTDLVDKLGLSDSRALRGRQYYCQGCCATTGQGIMEGFNWLQRQLA